MTDLDQFKSRFLRLLELRIERDVDQTKAEKSDKAFKAAEAELWEAVNDAGIKGSQTFDFGDEYGTVRFTPRQPTIYGRIIDKDTAIKALEAEGLDDVIYDKAVRKGRLNELVRDRFEAGSALPEGVDYYDQKGITISRKST